MLNKDIKNTGDNSGTIMGENSGNVIVVNGIDEKRVREICSDLYEIARRDFTNDANKIAKSRVNEFEKILLPKMKKVEGAFNVFADPSFQFLLTSAQKTAAATERQVDYDLLSELLVSRVNDGKDRKIRFGITRAVEIVDKIDDDALCALTLIYGIKSLIPTDYICSKGIIRLQDSFNKLCINLPKNDDWIDHLEILDCIRANVMGNMRKMDDLYSELMDGYFCVGIEKGSEQYNKALSLLDSVALSKDILVDNDLLDGFVRIPVANKKDILDISNNINENFMQKSRALNQQEIDVLNYIFDLYSINEDKKRNVYNNFFAIWNEDESLKNIKNWWDSIPFVIDITFIGEIIANTNANRLDSRIPKLYLNIN